MFIVSKKHLLLFVFAVATVAMACKKDKPIAPSDKSKSAWIVGFADSTGYGTILYTPDGGQTFQRQAAGLACLKDIDLTDVWAVDDNLIWVTGSKNTLLKSTDGGANWQQVIVPNGNTQADLYCIAMIGKNEIYVTGDSGTVYHSSNAGETWNVFDHNLFADGLLQGVCMVSANEVYVVGQTFLGDPRGIIRHTKDGGATWDSVAPPDDYNRNTWINAAVNGNTHVIYGTTSHYIVSTDNGLTWRNDSMPFAGGGGGADINHLIMRGPSHWWAALDQGHLVQSVDAGKNWSDPKTGQGISFMLGIDAWDDNYAIAVGSVFGWPMNGPIMVSNNGGLSWTRALLYHKGLNKVSFTKNISVQ